jgi:prepilin-type N-terminal cleavage/methylation domain-containing protein
LDAASPKIKIQIMKSLKARGFTLTELLVTITIIVVLAAVVFTMSSRYINSAHKTVCISNLRGIGNALQICISERNGILPGPLMAGQTARYDPVEARTSIKGHRLVNYIAPYMQDLKDTNERFMIDNFGCPSLLKQLKVNTVAKPAILYRLDNYKKDKLLTNRVPPEQFAFPWGYGSGAIPRHLDEINPISAGKVRMITEQNITFGVGGWVNAGASTSPPSAAAARARSDISEIASRQPHRLPLRCRQKAGAKARSENSRCQVLLRLPRNVRHGGRPDRRGHRLHPGPHALPDRAGGDPPRQAGHGAETALQQPVGNPRAGQHRQGKRRAHRHGQPGRDHGRHPRPARVDRGRVDRRGQGSPLLDQPPDLAAGQGP